MLEYAISKAHSKNIQLQVMITVNMINSPKRAEWRLFGPSSNPPFKFNIVSSDGVTKTGTENPWNAIIRLDMSYPELQDYEANLIGFIAKHYPTLDGINIEEPFYTTNHTS